MKKRISKILLLAMILSLLVPQFVLAENIYKDQSEISNWAIDHVLKATDKKIVSGYNGNFNPKNNITRAEFTKLIVEALNIKEGSEDTNFSDIKSSDWYYTYVKTASSNGIIKGANGKFNPNGDITREEMAVIISRGLGLKSENISNFKDSKNISKWAVEDINKVVGNEIILGSNGNFNPKDKATREMAAVVIMRAYDYKNILPEDVKVKEEKEPEPVKETSIKEIIKKSIDNSVAYLQKEVKEPMVGSIGGEWVVTGLNRSNRNIDNKFNEIYLNNLEKTLKEKSGQLHKTRYTEYSRVIIALNSLNKNPKDIFEYNLEKEIYDINNVKKQGINGPIYALIALNCKDSTLSDEKKIMLDYILENEMDNGGWALSKDNGKGDVDITAMAIQALAPYKDEPKVKVAIERGVKLLSDRQENDGGYTSWDSKNSENVSQVIMALSSIGIDANKDSRFVKNEKSLIDFLLAYQMESGGFKHEESGKENLMASQQANLALISYERFLNGDNTLYDMSK